MKCRRCAAEWQEKTRVCPVCGCRRTSAWTVALICVAAVLLLAALAVGGLWLFRQMSGRLSFNDTPPFSSDAQSVSTAESLTVRVTVPEGYTVQQIAALMESNQVCSAAEFIGAVQQGDFSEYDFVSQIPLTDDAGKVNGRVYRLEGYLYPDTYEFYKNCSGEAAVRRFLNNFALKWQQVQPLLAASGFTADEVVTLASIIQWETGNPTDMARVSRVLQNRLASPDYPRLQCDVTTRYLRALTAAGVAADEAVYDTYICRGLPVGAINNPGIDALLAAVSPSQEELCADCYFFVMDAATDTLYCSRTYAEHLAVCREHKLGSFAE